MVNNISKLNSRKEACIYESEIHSYYIIIKYMCLTFRNITCIKTVFVSYSHIYDIVFAIIVILSASLNEFVDVLLLTISYSRCTMVCVIKVIVILEPAIVTSNLVRSFMYPENQRQ